MNKETIKQLEDVTKKFRSMFEIFQEQLEVIAKRENVKIVTNFQLMVCTKFEDVKEAGLLSDILQVGAGSLTGKIDMSEDVPDAVAFTALEEFSKRLKFELHAAAKEIVQKNGGKV